MDLHQWLLALMVAMPFLGACAILLLRGSPNPREAASLTAAILTFLFGVISLPSAFTAKPPVTPALAIIPGLSLQLSADGLGLLFACLASLLWIFTTFHG